MSKVAITKSKIDDLANVIAQKTGEAAPMTLTEMESAVDNIVMRSSSDVTVSGATVTAPAGYYTSAVTKTVESGVAGTPMIISGSVSNHSKTLTPSVVNGTGYISGGTVTGTPKTISASDLVSGSQNITSNGTVDVTNLASVIVNVSGGGGGASNMVTGTFTGTTAGAALAVPLSYTGSGYPLAAIIFPAEGARNEDGTYYNTLHRYAFNIFAIAKSYPNTPTYTTSGNNNLAVTNVYYKSSSSNATSMSRSGSSNANTFSSGDAIASVTTGVRFKSATTMSVFISSTSYGFLVNTPYTYCVLYSS